MTKPVFLIFLTLLFASVLNAQSRFDQWDKNKDGKLSLDELPGPLQKNFERVDLDKDGFISRKEDAAMKRHGNALPENVIKSADIPYLDAENPRQALDLYLPKIRSSEDPLPVVCWIHGGGWRNGNKDKARLALDAVKSGDFAGISIGYRLTDEAQWPSQILDCKNAIRWIRRNADKYGFDPDRIGVAGSSAGGHLVTMLGVSNGIESLEKGEGDSTVSSEIACVVDFFGPTELLKMNEQGSSMDHNAADSPEALLIGGAIQKHKDKAIAASPISYVSKDDEPILIIHGTEDPLVPYQQSVDFEKALESKGVDVTLITVKKGGHGKGFPPKANELALQFFRNYLLGEKKPITDQELSALPFR